jgi:enamine deaminase RidA (YjgF/YER057c/UK114 family)
MVPAYVSTLVEGASMTIDLINPEELYTPLSYTQVAVAAGSRLVFIAGQAAHDGDGNLVGPGDLAAVGVESLAEPGYLIEVEAFAVID